MAKRRQASGRTWWLTLPDDPRGWRPAWWRLSERRGGCLFEHVADDGESGTRAMIEAPWSEALRLARQIVAANDRAHAQAVN
jgi:hypothetical protein